MRLPPNGRIGVPRPAAAVWETVERETGLAGGGVYGRAFAYVAPSHEVGSMEEEPRAASPSFVAKTTMFPSSKNGSPKLLAISLDTAGHIPRLHPVLAAFGFLREVLVKHHEVCAACSNLGEIRQVDEIPHPQPWDIRCHLTRHRLAAETHRETDHRSLAVYALIDGKVITRRHQIPWGFHDKQAVSLLPREKPVEFRQGLQAPSVSLPLTAQPKRMEDSRHPVVGCIENFRQRTRKEDNEADDTRHRGDQNIRTPTRQSQRWDNLENSIRSQEQNDQCHWQEIPRQNEETVDPQGPANQDRRNLQQARKERESREIESTPDKMRESKNRQGSKHERHPATRGSQDDLGSIHPRDETKFTRPELVDEEIRTPQQGYREKAQEGSNPIQDPT